MARFTLSLPTFRRSNPSSEQTATPAAGGAGAAPTHPSEGRRRRGEANPALSFIGAGVRAERPADTPAPRAAVPRLAAIPEAASAAITAASGSTSRRMPLQALASRHDATGSSGPRAVASETPAARDKGKAVMIADVASTSRAHPVTGREVPDAIVAPPRPRPKYATLPGEGWGMPQLRKWQAGRPRIQVPNVQLAQARAPEDGSQRAESLLKALADIVEPHAHATGNPAGAETSSCAPQPTALDLGMRLINHEDDALEPLLRLIASASTGAHAAAELSRTGGVAALVAASRAGDSGAEALSVRVGAILTQLTDVAWALDAAAPDEASETQQTSEARAQIDAARTSLHTVRADLAHCFVQRAIDEHRLPSEAAVLGEVGMLSGSHPGLLKAAEEGESRVLEGLVQLAARMAGDLRAMMAASSPDDRAALTQLGGRALDLMAILSEARRGAAELGCACPDGSARKALAQLARELDASRAWLNGASSRINSQPATGSEQSVLRTSLRPVAATAEATHEHMAELARQQTALGDLPKLEQHLRSERPGMGRAEFNDALCDKIAATVRDALGPHTPLDTRLELVRVAMCFSPRDAAAHRRLGRMLTSAALGTERPSAGEVKETIGVLDGTEIQHALYDRLGDITARLTADEAREFARSVPEHWSVDRVQNRYSSVRHAAEAIALKLRPPQFTGERQLPVPEETAWLGSARTRSRVVSDYIARCSARAAVSDQMIGAGYVDNRTAFRSILALASNMTERGHRHHLVAFAKELFQRDNDRIAEGNRPAVGSAQRFELLHAMAVQLPHFGTAAGDRQTVGDVLSLILQQLEKPLLQPRHKARLAKDLLDVISQLPTSRYSSSGAAQSYTLDALKAALAHLRGDTLASLLRQVLASRETLSGARSASGQLPRTRGQKRSAVVAAVVSPPLALAGALNFAWRTSAGRASPKDEALQIVLEALEQDLKRCVEERHPQSPAFVPLYGQLLRQLLATGAQSSLKSDKASLARLLSCIGQAQSPLGTDVTQRDQFIAHVLGDDRAAHAGLARMLTDAVKERGGPAATPLGRINAARFLQGLLAGGASNLSATEVQAARAAIERAALSKSADFNDERQLTPLLAIIHADRRDNLPIRSEVVKRAASALMTVLLSPTFVTQAREAAAKASQLVELYPLLDAATLDRMKAALTASQPAAPLERGQPGEQRQLPLIGLAASVLHCPGGPGVGDAFLGLLRAAWQGMNATNRNAALLSMFNGYDEATTAGRAAALSMVKEMREDPQFVSAALNLVAHAFGDDSMGVKQGDTESGQIVGMVLDRMSRMEGSHRSALVSNMVEQGDRLPQPLIGGFVRAAPDLEPRALAQVLSVELRRIGTLQPPQAAAVLKNWRDIGSGLPAASPQRETLQLFGAIAARAYPHATAPQPVDEGVPVPDEVAGLLRAASSTFTPELQEAVLYHVAGAGAPAEMQAAHIDDLLRDFVRCDMAQRQQAIDLGGPTAIGRALEALAKEFGAAHPANGFKRPTLDQPFLASGGPDGMLRTLRSALQDPARRQQEIALALETIAERFSQIPRAGYQEEFRGILDECAERLGRPLLNRVLETLALANPSLNVVDEFGFSTIGRELLARHDEDKTSDIVQAVLNGKTVDDAASRLANLRNGRPQLLTSGSAA